MNIRHYIRRFSIAFFVLAITCYSAYQVKNIARGMVITVDAPQAGETVQNSLVTIAGTALHAASISLNGRPILLNEEGGFREPLLLAPGYNVVTVFAKDRFGNAVEKKVELIYEPLDDAVTKTAASSTPTLQGA
jgi:hypothetical protein